MGLPQLADETVQIVLLSKCRDVALCAGPVAKHFGLTRSRAEAVLQDGHGVIAARIASAGARKILPLFAALGLRVAIRPLDAEPDPELFDMSLRTTTQAAGTAALKALDPLGFARASDFADPSGLILASLTEGQVQKVAVTLRAIAGVKVTVSAQSNASHDLFMRKSSADLTDLNRHLKVMGCVNAGPAAALATGLDLWTLTHILTRFPELGLFGVNQAFQRYDLQLVGRGRLSPQELRDFLFTRGIRVAVAGTVLQPDCGLTVEKGLSRAVAGQFLSDYATIGLSARADLALL